MKKVFIILGSFFALLLLAAVLLPIIFKDDIRAAIDKEIKASVNANVYYNTDAFGVTLFKNFPNITASVGDFGIAGIDKFEGDTLLDVKKFEITLDIMSVISGDKISILLVYFWISRISRFTCWKMVRLIMILPKTQVMLPNQRRKVSEPSKPLDIGIQKMAQLMMLTSYMMIYHYHFISSL